MSTIRIAMLGPGAAFANRRLAGAAIPLPAWDAGGWSSRGRVNGSPGTRGISAPSPVPVTGGAGLESRRRSPSGQGRVALAMVGPASGGMYLDDTLTEVWYPSIYYNYVENIPPVSVYSDNQMPVPAKNGWGQSGGMGAPIAVSPGGPQFRSTKSYGVVMAGILNRGQAAVPQPRVAQTFPKWRGARRGPHV